MLQLQVVQLQAFARCNVFGDMRLPLIPDLHPRPRDREDGIRASEPPGEIKALKDAARLTAGNDHIAAWRGQDGTYNSVRRWF